MAPLRIVALEGDETGQELLEQALRVLDPGRARHRARDRALRPLAGEPPRDRERASARRRPRRCARPAWGSRRRRSRPRAPDDVGSPNRILREAHRRQGDRAHGRRIPGVTPVAGVHHPISVCRMAVGDAYGAEQWREADDGDELAHRTETIRRSDCRAVAEYAFREAERLGGRVYGGPKWTVSPIYEGMLKEEMDAAAERHPAVAYEPVLIDATLAGLVVGAADRAARDPVPQPRRRPALGPRPAALRLDRRRRVGAAGARRRAATRGGDGRGAARDRARARRARTSPTRWG